MKIIIQNIATEYTDEGSGPIILCLHGWKDSLRTFDALEPELAKKNVENSARMLAEFLRAETSR